MDFGDEDDILVDDREAEEREECIQDVLELVIERVNAHLEAAELQGKVVGYAVGEAVKDALAVVDMTFVERESHATDAGKAEAEQVRGSWEPDDEPIPGEVDAWARGAVPARRREKTPIPEPKAAANRQTLPYRTASKSGASVKSGGVDKPVVGRQSTSLPTTKEPKGKTQKAKLSPEEAEREQRLRDEIASRKAVQEMQRLQIEKDKEELKQLELLQKELRGKEYGYDHNGQVVVLNKLDPEKLPAYAVGLRVNVFDNQDGFDDPAMADAPDRAKKVRTRQPLPRAKLFTTETAHPKNLLEPHKSPLLYFLCSRCAG